MEYITWIQSEFSTIAKAPVVYGVTIVVTIMIAAKMCKEIFGAEAAAKGAQCELLKEKISQLEGEKSALLFKLEVHGEDINKIKSQLDAMPRIVVSQTEPVAQREGDLWIKA